MRERSSHPNINKPMYVKYFTRKMFYQTLLIVFLVLLGGYLYSNVDENLERQGIATGFDFLSESAGFSIGESSITYHMLDSYGRAILVGILNSVHVFTVGIVCATILGFTIGVSRNSSNWLLSKIASTYVEICRNVPVVLHVIFWAAVIRFLPSVREPITLFENVKITNRGLYFPILKYNSVYVWMAVFFVIAVILSILLNRWATSRQTRTGIELNTLWLRASLIIFIPIIVWLFSGVPLEWDVPTLGTFNYHGGMMISPEYLILLIGISVYTSAFIAEIVRAGINSVPIGQIEAAKALGLKNKYIMRYIKIPQAMKVIVPPITSQYLSLAKNSSLGVLVGYPDLVNIGNTTLNQSGRAVEAIFIMMIVFLFFSLIISTVMNTYNRYLRRTDR